MRKLETHTSRLALQLSAFGKAEVTVDWPYTGITVNRARSRLYSAAKAAGMQVSTHVKYYYKNGQVDFMKVCAVRKDLRG